MLRCLLWDHDNTLLESLDLHWRKYQAGMHAFGITPRPEWKQKLPRANGPMFWQFLHDEHGLRVSQEEFLKVVDTWYRDHVHELVLRPGIVDMLNLARENEILQGVVTNGRTATVMQGLEAAGIADFFAVVVTSDLCVNRKPHPEPYQQAVKRLSDLTGSLIDPDLCLAIEDDLKGLESAKRAGLRTLYRPLPDKQEDHGAFADYRADQNDEFILLLTRLITKWPVREV